jgi:ribosome biogenesis GTPase
MDTLPFERATVVKQTGNLYKISFLPEWDPFQAVLSGKLRLKEGKLTNPVAVGDLVDGIMPAKPARVREHEEPAVITYVYPRRNYLIRKSANLSREAHIIAANIDMAYLVLSATEPQTPLPFIDRFLVTCQAYGVPATLLVNKYDELLSIPDYKDNSDHISEIYTRAGYTVLNVSAFDGTGLETLSMLLRDKISLFAGISGVGKSSLANTLDPSLSLKTAAISSAHLTGKHTTTFFEFIPLPGAGF